MSKRALASVALAGALLLGLSPAALACAPMWMPPDPTVSGTAEQANAFEVLVAKRGQQITQVYRMGVTVAGRGFAWVVPVPAVPDFLLVDEGELTAIDEALRPRFELRTQKVGACQGEGAETSAKGAAVGADFAGAPTAAAAPVQVIKRQSIGPFDAVVLEAESSGALEAWLRTNGFAVPSRLGPALSPYLRSGAKIVAVKLQPQQLKAGYVPPLGLSYPGEKVSLPLRLAALGAAQRSKVVVTVLGDRRAVPTTYRHGELNEAYIDFQNGGNNYDEVVAMAMAGAGGRAFVTDGALPMVAGRVQVQPTGWAGLRPDPAGGGEVVYTTGAEPAGMPAPPTWSQGPTTPGGGGGAATGGDTTAFSELLRSMKFATRLYTLMPPSAMTEDPGFVMAAKLPEVKPTHEATLEVLCGPQFTEENAPRAIRLANGEAYLVAEGVPTPWEEEKPLPRPMPRCGTISIFDELGVQQSLIEDNAELIRQVGQALRQVKVQVLGFTVGFGADGKLALLGGPGIAGLGAGLGGGGAVQGTASNPTGRTYVGSGCACAAPTMRAPSLAEGSEEAGSWALFGVGLGGWWWRGRRRRPRA